MARISQEKKMYVIENYANSTAQTIAAELGLSQGTVCNIARAAGIKKREIKNVGRAWKPPVKRIWPELQGDFVFADIKMMPDEYHESISYTRKYREIIGETAELIVTRSKLGYIETFRKKDPSYMLKVRRA